MPVSQLFELILATANLLLCNYLQNKLQRS